MKSALFSLLFVLMLSCGVFVIKLPPRYNEDGSVRRDKRRFSILKKPFITNPLIDNNYFYISTQYKKGKNRNGYLYRCLGFLKDGRFITSSVLIFENEPKENLSKKLNEVNSWKTSYSYGYYTANADTVIEIQYFYRPTETWSINNDQVNVSTNGDTIFKYGIPYIKSQYEIIVD